MQDRRRRYGYVGPADVRAEISNHSTGYCPDISSWPALAEALDRAGLGRRSGFTHEVLFRRSGKAFGRGGEEQAHMLAHGRSLC
ncbi:hypothetical protein ACTMTF_37435 [Nonomuraea sp. ZG12]|uniref:hypothetical protein n=1 Tax=Nonomuraea sp. ZG12 TaxID=3452207 RepID=UPI003F8B8EFB